VTEGAPAPFAVHGDVVARGRPFRDTAEQNRAVTRLGDASALLRTVIKDIDARIAADTSGNLAAVATSTVVDAVVRFLQNPEGAKQLQETIGPRSYGMTFDGRPTGIFFTAAELAALRPSAGASTQLPAVGTAFLGMRPGWAPVTPGWGPGL
jgi:hypothetical protein